jgi:hypothetical protein
MRRNNWLMTRLETAMFLAGVTLMGGGAVWATVIGFGFFRRGPGVEAPGSTIERQVKALDQGQMCFAPEQVTKSQCWVLVSPL